MTATFPEALVELRKAEARGGGASPFDRRGPASGAPAATMPRHADRHAGPFAA
jgi:hypothetical protein